MSSRSAITSFRGEFAFLSNFYACLVEFEGVMYPSAEHAFQAAKTLDKERRRCIALAPSPTAAKRMGRRLKLRADWEGVKLDVMETILRDKFSDDGLAESLKATGTRRLVEGNTWGDKYWGKVMNEHGKLEGGNNLGKLLMKIREEMLDG